MKTLSVLLLAVSLRLSAVHCAPAPHSDVSRFFRRLEATSAELENDANSGDADSGDAPAARPAATAFFTPAVFLDNYYSRTRTPAPEPTEGMNEDVAFLDPTAVPYDAATAYDATATFTDWASDPTTVTPVEPTATDTDASEPSITASLDDDAATMTPDVSVSSASLLNPTSVLNIKTAPTTSQPAVAKPTQTHASSSESPRTLQSRKAAIVGTFLALASLVALMACASCMRCRLPCLSPRKQDGKADDSAQHYDKDPEKAQQLSQEKSPNTNLNVVTLPVLNSAIPNASSDVSAPDPGSSGRDAQQLQTHNKQEWRFLSAREDGQFEDVTHILSEDTFAAHDSDSGSDRSSTSSGGQGSLSGERQSHANSIARSYATCESRYSTPSIQRGDESISEQTASFHSAPSPPESPVPETPKHQQFVTRPRSKTFTSTQPLSPATNDKMSSSKSFPARYSNRSSAPTSRLSMFSEESEWDIAAAYGARYSKGHSPSELSPITENMAAVEIGGRNCILVHGVAF